MFRDILFPEDQERTLIEIQAFVKENIETYTQFYRIITKQGEVRWVEDRTSVIEDTATGIRYHQGIVIDIHKRKVAEEKLRKSEEKYRRIVETAGEGFLLMDKSLKLIDLNSAYARMVSSPRSELIGHKPFGADSDQFQQFWTAGQKETGREYREFECELQLGNQRTVPVLVHANALRSDTGELIGNMAFVTDMTEQKKALSLAGEVQRSLLPDKAPLIQGLEVAGRNVPCDEVGGDYFDYLWNADLDEGTFTVVVGDITGHGVDSALLMSSARAFLRMRASQPGSITDIVTDMNQHMTEDVYATGRFMTLVYLTIGETRKSIDWIRAGHDPALLYDPGLDQFEELKGPGMALGVDKDYIYQRQHRDGLTANQLIVLGTDGIWEGSSKTGEMFGKERFKDTIRRNASKSAETILTTIFQEHADFTRGMKTTDDITLVIVKIV
jgi:sigma-B regulation protein RsbU (phosphoserine phosphatase)